MLVELLRRSGMRGRLLFASQAAVPTLIILMTTVSCSRHEMPQPVVRIVDLFFPDDVTGAANPGVGEGKAKVQREQPKSSTSPKVAKATGTSVSREASKKAGTSPRLDSQTERDLFEEFLEWRRRQTDQR